jgi:hypothetical protein
MAFRNMKALNADFFFKNKAALDNDNLLHHRCFALLSNRWYGTDRTTDRYLIDLHAFMIQHFIDYALTLAGNDADSYRVAHDLLPRHR